MIERFWLSANTEGLALNGAGAAPALSWAYWGKVLLLVLALIALAALFTIAGLWGLDRFSSLGGDPIDLLFAITCAVFVVCSVVTILFLAGVMMVVALSGALDKLR